MSFANVNGRQIEYRMIPGDAGRTPLVLLHEGLGSIALWRDFPEKLARRLGRPAVIYSRFGYGQSDGLTGKRTPAFMREEAVDVLPLLLDQLGIGRTFLVGHSDGASIAILYAALSDREVEGLALLAPHVIVEDVTVESIARVRSSYDVTDLRARLSKYHANVDDAFLGWADIWLDPAFRSWSIEEEVARVTAPMLLVQGEDDEYGTFDQLDRIALKAKVAVDRLVLPRCGHSPHRDQEAAVIEAIVAFAAGLSPAD